MRRTGWTYLALFSRVMCRVRGLWRWGIAPPVVTYLNAVSATYRTPRLWCRRALALCPLKRRSGGPPAVSLPRHRSCPRPRGCGQDHLRTLCPRTAHTVDISRAAPGGGTQGSVRSVLSFTKCESPSVEAPLRLMTQIRLEVVNTHLLA